MSTAEKPPPAPPRVFAISGMIFAALYIASLVLARLAVPADPAEPGAWRADPTLRSWLRFALNLIAFTGIAFLWFCAIASAASKIGSLRRCFWAAGSCLSGRCLSPRPFPKHF